MKIVPLSPAWEPKFWEHVNRDIPHYFFFALDWIQYRTDTEILLALKKNHIDGMMLIFKQRTVQLRGSVESVKALLERLALKKAEFRVSKQHEKYVLEKYVPTRSHELILMVLHKGEERLHISHPIVTLDSSDAGHIADLMTEANPEFWGEITSEQIAEGGKTVHWVGIKEDGELLSIGRSRLTEKVGIIHTVATQAVHRNKGYGTSITSYLVKRILEKAPIAIIFTLEDNPPANKVYQKVGFKPYKKYAIMEGERR